MPLLVFGTLVITSLIRPQGFLKIATTINDAILAGFSNIFAFAAFACLLSCLWAALSPIGKIRIGGKDAEPLLSRWNWMAITLTTTIAVGILFWATAEPLYHLYNPASSGPEPGSEEAARFSLVSLYMHWSFTPYAIYTIPGLTFALVYYNLKTPFSLSSPLTIFTGKPVPQLGADLLDSIALLALLFGLSASLGSGIMSISGAIARLTPFTTGPVMLAIVAALIVTAFFISSATGLHKAETSLTLKADEIVGDLTRSIEQIKATPEDRLRDVRIHFIDAGNDYQIGLASARDRAAETVRILDVNAPLVMDRSFAKLIADRLLTRAIEEDVTLNFQLSEKRLDIEVGDLISLPYIEGAWRVETLEGLTTQNVQARRAGYKNIVMNSGVKPQVTQTPFWTAKPNLFAVDVPGPYAGPLIGVALDPFAPTDISSASETLRLDAPARIGALLTELRDGPVGRWDAANKTEIFLPGLSLSSVSDVAIFDGANRLAVETAGGWEIFQAANAELIAPSTYRLSRLLRGQDGSDFAMQEVTASGARIIWLGAGWIDLPLADELIGETISMTARAAGRTSDVLNHLYKATHLRPLSPVHVKLSEANGQITLSWTRRTRIGGDSWAGLDVPLGEEEERYRVQLWSQDAVIAEYEVTEPSLSLTTFHNADAVTISQASRAYGWGAAASVTL